MTLILAWGVFPLALMVASLGLGLGVERLSGRAVASGLLAPLGFAALLAVVLITSALPVRWLLPLALLAGAAAGFLLRTTEVRLRDRLLGDRWILAAGAAVFCVYLLPVAATGTATFAGWIKLDDGATWLALGDHILQSGRTTADMVPSTQEALISTLMGEGGPDYPASSFAPLGMGMQWLGVTGTALLQPYLAFLAVLVASSLASVLGRLLSALRPLRAVAVLLASQPALLYGYAMWGGIKEVALAFLVPAAAVAAVGLSRDPLPGWASCCRAVLPLAVLMAGGIAVGGFSAATWFPIPLAFLAIATVRRHGWSQLSRVGVGLVVTAGLLTLVDLVQVSIDAVRSMGSFAAGSEDISNEDIGTLWGRLLPQQVAGIWLAGDFRAQPLRMDITWVLIVLVALLAAAGAVWGWRRSHPEIALYVVATVPLALLLATGGAWIGGKALAIASPALLTAAAAGVAWLWVSRRRTEAVVAGAAVAAGVSAGTMLTYHQVWLAPAGELAELAAIGQGPDRWRPALITDYSPYGARYLLAHLDAEGAGELRRSVIPRTSGSGLGKTEYADIDEFQADGLNAFNSLILRRSATASRPPSNFVLEQQGQQYEVWRRDSDLSAPVARLPLGDWDNPVAVPQCSEITALAARAAALPPGTVLVAAPRQPPVRVDTSSGDIPGGWIADPAYGSVQPRSDGTATYTFEVPRTGRYPLFLRGSYQGAVSVAIDGSEVFADTGRLVWQGHGAQGPEVDLDRGRHTLTLTYSAPWWQPGTGGFDVPAGGGARTWPLGPINFGPTAADTPLLRVSPDRARSLCGRPLDWVELVAPSTS